MAYIGTSSFFGSFCTRDFGDEALASCFAVGAAVGTSMGRIGVGGIESELANELLTVLGLLFGSLTGLRHFLLRFRGKCLRFLNFCGEFCGFSGF